MARLPIALANPGAESDTGTTDGHGIAITGWTTVTGQASAVQYGAPGGFPGVSDPGPPNRGANFWDGGKVALSVITQTLNFTGYETDIDANHVTFGLSAWLGGSPDQDDNAVITLVWKTSTGGGGSTISTSTLGPALLAERGAINGTILKQTAGAVPATARSVVVTITFNRTAGTDNDAYVDNIDLHFDSFEGTLTVADHIVNTSKHNAFYYLKITGLPYYFGTFNPTDSRTWLKPPGSTASSTDMLSAEWELADGYSWIGGMEIPSGALEQSLKDLIGGVASAERIKLEVADIPLTDRRNTFFGRLLAAGRLTTNASATIGKLVNDIDPGVTGAILEVDPLNGASGPFVADTDVYVGGETMGISTVTPGGGITQEINVTERNKYPCNANYPPCPFFRVEKDPNGDYNPLTAGFVTQGGPMSLVGRSAALYIGHLLPDGRPEPEANSLCRLIGHIKGVSRDKPTSVSIEIESVMADLTTAKVAPQLAHAEMQPGIHLPNASDRTFTISVSLAPTDATTAQQLAEGTKTYTIADDGDGNVYDNIAELQHAINATIAADPIDLDPGSGTLTFQVYGSPAQGDDGTVFSFTVTCPDDVAAAFGAVDVSMYMSVIDNVYGVNKKPGLLKALGFLMNKNNGVKIDANHKTLTVYGDRELPTLFIPGNSSVTEVALVGGPDANGQRFFTDQGDGSDRAWVRFSNGQIGRVTGSTSSSVSLMGVGAGASASPFVFNSKSSPLYLTSKDALTVDQILHFGTEHKTDADTLFARLLASKGYDGDDEYNVFPPGAGLGLDGILDKESFRNRTSVGGAVNVDIDATMTFMDLWTGYAKERGLYLVWDPETTQITVRQIELPNSAAAGTFIFTESNRSKTDDRSKWSQDFANLRTAWTFKYGWDAIQKKFTGAEITINDPYAQQAYPQQAGARTETIEDRLVPASTTANIGEVIGAFVGRLKYTQIPWDKITRTVNKRGLLLSPGRYHKIIDATLVNPFTGVLGIDDDDDVYAYIFSVRSVLETGEVMVTLLLDGTTDQTTLRPWAPTALLDFSAPSNGYVSATGVVTLDNRFLSSTAGGTFDGIDFEVGDKVSLVPYDNSVGGAPAYEKHGTISAISADGSTATIDTGLGAVDTLVESLMVLRDWADGTAARRTGSSRVAFQGSGDDLLIVGTDRLHKWS